MRLFSTLAAAAALVASAPSVLAQACTPETAIDVTVRQINAIPQANIDLLEAAGEAVTIEQAQALLTNDLEGTCVRFTAVLLTDPLKSGLRSLNPEGIPYGIHTYVRDVTADTHGADGMGIQVVDLGGDGQMQPFFPGDVLEIVGVPEPFRGGGGVSQQLTLVAATATGAIFGPDAPIRQPLVITPDVIHDTYLVDGVPKTQIDWTSYSDFSGQYVRFEGVEILTAVPGPRSDVLLAAEGEDSKINLFDTSVCFRSDRGPEYFPNGGAPACIDDPFNPPPSGTANLQGFLVFQGDDGFFDYSVPGGANYVIVPFEDSDFEIVAAPPILVLGTPTLAQTDDLTIAVTAAPGGSGATIAAVEASVVGDGFESILPLVNTTGDEYVGSIGDLPVQTFLTYTVTATDSDGNQATSEAVGRRVVDGAVASIGDVQATPDGGPGPSGVTTPEPVPFDLSVTVQSVMQSGTGYFATVQDDDQLGAFTGVWVAFGDSDPGVQPGDQLLITQARVEEWFELTRLNEVAFVAQGAGPVLDDKTLVTSDLLGPEGDAMGEQHEGMVLTFDAVTVVATNADAPAGPFGEFGVSSDGPGQPGLRVDDVSNAIDYPDSDPAVLVTEGEVRAFVRGPLYYSFGAYKLTPPSRADIGAVVGDAQLVVAPEALVASVPSGDSEALTLTLSNAAGAGSDDLAWSLAEAADGGGDIPWLALAPASGTTEAGVADDIAVTFDAVGLADGTYTADLVVTSSDPARPTVTIGVTLVVEDAPTLSVVIDGERGVRYLGAPAEGLTVDDLAAQNLVRGVPGYYATNPSPTLWTSYDPVSGQWVPAAGTGEVLALGHAFRWYLLDRDDVGDPTVSVSHALPFTLSTNRTPNNRQVRIALDTSGNRFNHLANPFGQTIDLSGIRDWQGGLGLSPNSEVYTYDPATGAWGTAASVAPWQAFRFRAKGPRGNGNPRNLTIPVSAQVPAAARTASSERPALRFALAATSASGRALADRMLTVAFDGASAAFDMDEDVEKFQPPTTAYALIGARAGAEILGHDARPFAAAEIPLAVEIRGTTSELTLSWDANTLPSGLPVVLVDLATGEEIDVRAQSSYAFRAQARPALDEIPLNDLADGGAATDRFVLRIGAALATADDVTAVALDAPVPNPSTGSARLGFAVPEAGAVRLSVFDARGREVAVLVDGSLAAGRHEAALPASLAAGVYVVRLEAGGTVATQRAAVVR